MNPPRVRWSRGVDGVLCAALLSAGFTSTACGPNSGGGAGRRMVLQGDYVHAGSGIVFPESAGGFGRTSPRQYDDEGKDVGIGYPSVLDEVSPEDRRLLDATDPSAPSA